MNWNRLLLAATESPLAMEPLAAFGTVYLSAVLSAYAQHYGQTPVRSLPVHPGVDLETLWQAVSDPSPVSDRLILHALESLASPLTPDTTIADLAWDWRLATVLVVPLRPNTVSQTIAFTAFAQQRRCLVQGLVFYAPDLAAWNDRFCLAPLELIQSFTPLPILGLLPPWNADQSSLDLARLASDLQLEYFSPVDNDRGAD